MKFATLLLFVTCALAAPIVVDVNEPHPTETDGSLIIPLDVAISLSLRHDSLTHTTDPIAPATHDAVSLAEGAAKSAVGTVGETLPIHHRRTGVKAAADVDADEVVSTAKTSVENAAGTVQNNVEAAEDIATEAVSAAKTHAEDAVNHVSDHVGDAVDGAVSTVEDVKDKVTGAVSTAKTTVEGAVASATEVVEDAEGIATDVVAEVEPIVEDAADTAVSTVKAPVDKVATHAGIIAEDANDLWEDIAPETAEVDPSSLITRDEDEDEKPELEDLLLDLVDLDEIEEKCEEYYEGTPYEEICDRIA